MKKVLTQKWKIKTFQKDFNKKTVWANLLTLLKDYYPQDVFCLDSFPWAFTLRLCNQGLSPGLLYWDCSTSISLDHYAKSARLGTREVFILS